ncbi:hypothetical protein L1049_024124 [Liquidambar formosana]|uniref:Uncharacterized protein n=1 Tax=Liquidambar formosana TaxID=63359 RepID=A0AAP0S085_LIQFO
MHGRVLGVENRVSSMGRKLCIVEEDVHMMKFYGGEVYNAAWVMSKAFETWHGRGDDGDKDQEEGSTNNEDGNDDEEKVGRDDQEDEVGQCEFDMAVETIERLTHAPFHPPSGEEEEHHEQDDKDFIVDQLTKRVDQLEKEREMEYVIQLGMHIKQGDQADLEAAANCLQQNQFSLTISEAWFVDLIFSSKMVDDEIECGWQILKIEDLRIVGLIFQSSQARGWTWSRFADIKPRKETIEALFLVEEDRDMVSDSDRSSRPD